MELTREFLDRLETDFDASRANTIAMNAVTNNGVLKAAENCHAHRDSRHTYSISLKQGSITSQKHSGRCWMFAALNVMRFDIIHSLNLEDFELSQNYPLFYDKLEKSNYFLESILQTLDEPTEGRLISFLLQSPVGDGGQWDMFANLVRKYGVVPKDAMPETFSSSATHEMVSLLTELLRSDACILREAYAAGASMEQLQDKKTAMMEEVYRLLCICLGKPPKTFDFEVRDKDDTFLCDRQITPTAFYEKYIGWDLDDYVSLIHAPTADKPYYRSYSVRFLGNVAEGRIVRYLNLPADVLKQAAIAQMKDGKPVWFGCDVGKSSGRDSGIMDLDLYNREALFDLKLPMTKAQRLDYGQSLMTHAMVFMGVDLDEQERPLRWRVENSWGKEPGKDGYYVMTDRWFDEYTYQIVVHKKYLSDEYLKQYEAEPAMLEPWDPMGSLALTRA
ncbi:MAG: C1 family peptidase [Lachnospiraceae bacterium]|jgi:bleomycin hydrolase|nr:C1 family peptidase [Lachnospiraceae bacterium]